jgi:hypothetical protein
MCVCVVKESNGLSWRGPGERKGKEEEEEEDEEEGN